MERWIDWKLERWVGIAAIIGTIIAAIALIPDFVGMLRDGRSAQVDSEPTLGAVVERSTKFAYGVAAQSRESGERLGNVAVSLDFGDRASLKGVTSSSGLFTFQVDERRTGEMVLLRAELPGYRMASEYVTLEYNSVPFPILLSALETPAPAMVALSPTVTPTQEPPTKIPVEPQEVRWGPVDGQPAGLCLSACDLFIDWDTVKRDVEAKLLHQVAEVPTGSSIRLNSFDGKADWVVEIISPSGAMIGGVWFGTNPLNDWGYDGLIRLGRIGAAGSVEVWGVFQRYSDGSFRRR